MVPLTCICYSINESFTGSFVKWCLDKFCWIFLFPEFLLGLGCYWSLCCWWWCIFKFRKQTFMGFIILSYDFQVDIWYIINPFLDGSVVGSALVSVVGSRVVVGSFSSSGSDGSDPGPSILSGPGPKPPSRPPAPKTGPRPPRPPKPVVGIPRNGPPRKPPRVCRGSYPKAAAAAASSASRALSSFSIWRRADRFRFDSRSFPSDVRNTSLSTTFYGFNMCKLLYET